MKNATSKLSLLTALLCLVFTVQAQVTNPHHSSFEVDLTGDTDPHLILKREVTSGGGGGGPTSGTNPPPATTTSEYYWQINAKSGGLHFVNLPYFASTSGVNALRLDAGGAYFNGNLLSVGNSLTVNSTGATIDGDLLSVGNSLTADASGLTVSGNNISFGSHSTIDPTGTTFKNTALVVQSGNNTPHFELDDFTTLLRTDLKVIANDFTVQNASGDTDFKVNSNGTVFARKVTVLPNGMAIPDYVFEPDYDLMSIEALEAFIKEHGHLPNIKSADEYAEIGTIDLAELNIQLLEKVEEQSLYTIDLQKQVKELKAELEALKAVLTEIASKP